MNTMIAAGRRFSDVHKRRAAATDQHVAWGCSQYCYSGKAGRHDGERIEAQTGESGLHLRGRQETPRHLLPKGNCTIMPRHPSKEVKKGTVQDILKALGIEER